MVLNCIRNRIQGIIWVSTRGCQSQPYHYYIVGGQDDVVHFVRDDHFRLHEMHAQLARRTHCAFPLLALRWFLSPSAARTIFHGFPRSKLAFA